MSPSCAGHYRWQDSKDGNCRIAGKLGMWCVRAECNTGCCNSGNTVLHGACSSFANYFKNDADTAIHEVRLATLDAEMGNLTIISAFAPLLWACSSGALCAGIMHAYDMGGWCGCRTAQPSRSAWHQHPHLATGESIRGCHPKRYRYSTHWRLH